MKCPKCPRGRLIPEFMWDVYNCDTCGTFVAAIDLVRAERPIEKGPDEQSQQG